MPAPPSSSSSAIPSGAPKQSTLLPYLQKISARQRRQLTNKFQLAHFLIGKNKSFKFYQDMVSFEERVHQVDMGSSYNSDKSAKEIVSYLSKSIVLTEITEPLNSNAVNYYSVLNDGSSSAKTNDEKEIFLIKTGATGVPKFEVMSLEEPESCNAEGLQKALTAATGRMDFSFPRSQKELGMCSDGASVNVKLHQLVQEELGEHYTLVLCPSHKVELAIGDAFKVSELNTLCQEDVTNVYYLFKKATLRWRLFKQHARCSDFHYLRYKRPTGTRWTEHQTAALGSYNNNLSLLIGYCNNQIAQPYNDTMKKAVPKLQGILRNITKTNRILFNAIKQDILAGITPMTKVLQDTQLILPELITLCWSAQKTVKKLRKLLDDNGVEVFEREDIFPVCLSFLSSINREVADLIPERRSRSVATDDVENYLFHGYLIKGSTEAAARQCLHEYRRIVQKLEDSLDKRMSSITKDEFFLAVADVLNTQSYMYKTCDELFLNVSVIVTKFKSLLIANGCQLAKLQCELDILREHVVKFLPCVTPVRAWLQIFAIKHALGVQNILHIIELGIALPIGNAESERVFSFLWRVFSKERQSLSNDAMLDVLRLRCDTNYDPQRYERAIELF